MSTAEENSPPRRSLFRISTRSRIKAAAERFGVKVEADDWRELFEGGKAKKQ